MRTMLELRTRAGARRHKGKQIDVLETRDGKRLRVMKYRMPDLTFETADCGVKPLRFVDVEHLTQLLWSCCVDVAEWRATLEAMDLGLPAQILAELHAGGNWQGFSGERLKSLCTEAAAQGLLPILMRAPFVKEYRRGAFIQAWSTPSGRETLSRYARFIPQRRPSLQEDRALETLLEKRFGIPLAPKLPRSAGDDMRTIHEMVIRSSGMMGERNRMRTNEEFAAQQQRREQVQGGCGGCSN